jgi:hypothetical protein
LDDIIRCIDALADAATVLLEGVKAAAASIIRGVLVEADQRAIVAARRNMRIANYCFSRKNALSIVVL